MQRLSEIRKDFNYHQQMDASVDEIAVALPEAEKLATADKDVTVLQS